MNKYFYITFLGISTVHEISLILQIPLNTFIIIIYPIFFIYILIFYILGKMPEWVWLKGLSIIGISSLILIILSLFGFPKRPLEVIDSFIGLYVWFKSVVYLQRSDT